MSERCAYSDLPANQCAHCLGHAGPADERDEPRGSLRWAPARYPGRCADCGEPFDVGAQIRAHAEGWIAECCGDAQ